MSNAGNAPGGVNKFYFYTASTVAYGKQEFKRIWGNRQLTENWRWSSELRVETANAAISEDDTLAVSGARSKDEKADPRYMPEFYISQLPTSQVVIDSLAK